jgi:Flp pilus assembly protein TadB
MILVTIHLPPTDAYTVLVNLYSYTIVAVFGFAIAIGMLKLRFSSRERWRTKSRFHPFPSILSAFIFTIGSLYPIVASWVPPMGAFVTHGPVVWYTTPTVAWSILAFGVLWYLSFLLYAKRRLRKEGVEFQVQKVPEFDRDIDGPIQVGETVFRE